MKLNVNKRFSRLLSETSCGKHLHAYNRLNQAGDLLEIFFPFFNNLEDATAFEKSYNMQWYTANTFTEDNVSIIYSHQQ